eukprot:TRINITY_DN5579_c0_g2_i1.p1 TRINITY_DN5579_c0_g2~~TRINITY_DN5579_c0_g2_i1.p1  ORF type:complete len:1120 (+),score=209.14 TRINITY_DN5579_c0_g2_i1:50-3409(+)
MDEWTGVCRYSKRGKTYGHRMWHKKTGFTVDVLDLKFVPQALIYVNTPSRSDAGEAHTLEHLLLGKGKRAKYVRTFEEVSLATATAFTERKRTMFTVQTLGEGDALYQILTEKIKALLEPDFSDVEIQHEVRHMVITDKECAEEKGTVYMEQVGAFQHASHVAYAHVYKCIYGSKHPLSWEQGGSPEAIRTLTPERLRDFHAECYHLENMGIVVATSDDFRTVLTKLNGLLLGMSPKGIPHLTTEPTVGQPPRVEMNFPPPAPVPDGTYMESTFAHLNPHEPGKIIFCWPGILPYTLSEQEDGWIDYALLLIFVVLFADGDTSTLYSTLLDTEATSVTASVNEEKGLSLIVSFEGVKSSSITPSCVASLKQKVKDGLEEVISWRDNSDQLNSFNIRVFCRVQCLLKHSVEFLQHPPEFGVRGHYGEWVSFLDKAVEFTKDSNVELTFDKEAAAIEELLSTGENFWGEYLTKWGLHEREPCVVVCKASPEQHESDRSKTEERCRSFMEQLSVSPEQYRADYERAVDEIDANTSITEQPPFTSNPPMTFDPVLQYEVLGSILTCSVPELNECCYFGYALSVRDIPPRLAMHMVVLPTLHSYGVWLKGTRIPYDVYGGRIQQEILYIDSYMSVSSSTDRVEVVVRGAGLKSSEVSSAAEWCEAVLCTPLWDVDNLPRIRDIINEQLREAKDVMKSRAEFWGTSLAGAYRQQHNYHKLFAECCLLQEYCFLRLKYQLATPEKDVLCFLNRVRLISDLRVLKDELISSGFNIAADLLDLLHQMPEGEGVPYEWQEQCEVFSADVAKEPKETLDEWKEMLDIVSRRQNCRGYIITGNEHVKGVQVVLQAVIDKLPEKRESLTVPHEKCVDNRWRRRNGNANVRDHVGLLHTSSTQGVVVHKMPAPSMSKASMTDAEAKMLLAAKAWCGGGAHTPFVKSWNKGLAYSSGIGCDETGSVMYYADHCGNVGDTLEFAEKFFRTVKVTSGLRDYALCQCFTSRAGQTYIARCEALGTDIADGLTPDVVHAYRRRLLDVAEQLSDSDIISESKYLNKLFAQTPPMGSLRFVIGSHHQHSLYPHKTSLFTASDFWVTEYDLTAPPPPPSRSCSVHVTLLVVTMTLAWCYSK